MPVHDVGGWESSNPHSGQLDVSLSSPQLTRRCLVIIYRDNSLAGREKSKYFGDQNQL